MLLKKITLSKPPLPDAFIEVHFDKDTFTVVTKDESNKRLKEMVEYVGKNPREAAVKTGEALEAKIMSGYIVSNVETNKDAKCFEFGEKYIPRDTPPKELVQLSGFVASEAFKTLKGEGYDVGDYAFGAITMKHCGEKRLESMTLVIKFMKGKPPLPFDFPKGKEDKNE